MRGSECSKRVTASHRRSKAPPGTGGPGGSTATCACEPTWRKSSPASDPGRGSKLRGSPAAATSARSIAVRSHPRRKRQLGTRSVDRMVGGRVAFERFRLVGTALGLGVDESLRSLPEGDRHAIDELAPGARLHDLARRQKAGTAQPALGPCMAADVEDQLAVVVVVAAEGDATGLGMAGEGAEGEALPVDVDDAHAGGSGAGDAQVDLVARFERAPVAREEDHQFVRREGGEVPAERGDQLGGAGARRDRKSVGY